MSEEEKNSIREQHTGGRNLMIENFNKLISTKSGDVKPLVNEQYKEPVKTFDPVLSKMAKSTSVDESLERWGSEIGSKLKGTQVIGYEVDTQGKPKGDPKSYFIDGISSGVGHIMTGEKVSSLYDINEVVVVFKSHVVTVDLKGVKKNEKRDIELAIRFEMSKSFVVGISSVDISGEGIMLSTDDFEKQIIPKIGKIQMKNPCFDGYLYL
jgi:hypothetical protein